MCGNVIHIFDASVNYLFIQIDFFNPRLGFPVRHGNSKTMILLVFRSAQELKVMIASYKSAKSTQKNEKI